MFHAAHNRSWGDHHPTELATKYIIATVSGSLHLLTSLVYWATRGNHTLLLGAATPFQNPRRTRLLLAFHMGHAALCFTVMVHNGKSSSMRLAYVSGHELQADLLALQKGHPWSVL